MTRLLLFIVVCLGLLPMPVQAQKNSAFIPGEVWKDTDGNPINAHGGGLLYHNGTYLLVWRIQERENHFA